MNAAKLLLCTLLHLLIPLQSSCNGTATRSHSHSHSHSNAMDHSSKIFFFLKDLKLGNTIPTYFPTRELSDSLPHLLSKQQADSIPFSSPQLPHILRILSFSRDSPQAKAMAETLEECDREPIKGEKKSCATSMESMYEFLEIIFGPTTSIKALATVHIKRTSDDGGGGGDGDGLVQRYSITGIKQIPAPKMVSCHTMPYAYTVFYCHYHDSESRVYRVALKGEKGDEVEAIAVCHMDTSEWGRSHVAFEALGVEPGSTPVCHFFPADNFVLVPTMGFVQEY